MKCIYASNKLLLLRWFKFLLLLTNSLQNRITFLLVLKLLQSIKLTPLILFFFFLLRHNVFVSFVLLFFQFKKKKISLHLYYIYIYIFFFFWWLEKVEISNYNKCKLLIFTQKIEKPLSTRSRTCSEASDTL